MVKRILITATELHMLQFWTYHIDRLLKDGNEVDLVCSNVGDKLDLLKKRLADIGNPKLTIVDLKRSPLSPHNINGYFQLRRYFIYNKYDIVITNEPVMGIMTRLAARSIRKKGTKVIYFAHGFHFWNGAPKSNWMIFYPIEKIAAHFTDTIVTMNSEDYELAKSRLKAGEIKLTYGIGADLSKFYADENIRQQKRSELGLTNEKMIFTVSELSERKNLSLALNAVKKVIDDGYNVKYFIRGVGPLEQKHKKFIADNNLQDRVFLLGYGKDIMELCNAADVFLFTSKQEGLPVAVMEAMSCRLPCVVSDIRGVNDLISEGEGGYCCSLDDVDSFSRRIEEIIDNSDLKKGLTKTNFAKLEPYRLENVFEFLNSLVSE